jgi:type VI secretion system secreted protein VgrG
VVRFGVRPIPTRLLGRPRNEDSIGGGHVAVITQVDRLMILDTPRDPDTLLITSFTGHEGMSQLFRWDVEMVADKTDAASVKVDDIIGQKFTISVAVTTEYETSPRRHFNGIVSRLVQRHTDRRFIHYRAEVVPWLWLLTR